MGSACTNLQAWVLLAGKPSLDFPRLCHICSAWNQRNMNLIVCNQQKDPHTCMGFGWLVTEWFKGPYDYAIGKKNRQYFVLFSLQQLNIFQFLFYLCYCNYQHINSFFHSFLEIQMLVGSINNNLKKNCTV